ncbi:hypothetical protein BDV18DRAFT_161263 [Aspergillus unguis]
MSDTRSETSSASTAATNEPIYNYAQCIAALEGTSLPDDLSSATARCAVVRGLRCSYELTTSSSIIDLYANPDLSRQYPEIIRACNARLIMSNVVPEGLEPVRADVPACLPELLDAQLAGDRYRRVSAFGGYVERYVWPSFDTLRKIEVDSGRYGYYTINDTSPLDKYRIREDGNGEGLISDEGEK